MGPTSEQVLEVARNAIEIFERNGLKCCLVGSVASYLYGVQRTPSVSIDHSYVRRTICDSVLRT